MTSSLPDKIKMGKCTRFQLYEIIKFARREIAYQRDCLDAAEKALLTGAYPDGCNHAKAAGQEAAS